VVKAGSTSSHIAYFGDFFATACALTGATQPVGLDSISFAPTLTGKGRQKTHKYLYWEFYEQGSRQAVRFGDWKVIREPIMRGEMWKTLREPKMIGRVELFNLATDPREEKDLSAEKPLILKRGIHYMNEAHVDDPRWEIKPAGPNEIP
jgi:arylsulfatase A-like enzyme